MFKRLHDWLFGRVQDERDCLKRSILMLTHNMRLLKLTQKGDLAIFLLARARIVLTQLRLRRRALLAHSGPAFSFY